MVNDVRSGSVRGWTWPLMYRFVCIAYGYRCGAFVFVCVYIYFSYTSGWVLSVFRWVEKKWKSQFHGVLIILCSFQIQISFKKRFLKLKTSTHKRILFIAHFPHSALKNNSLGAVLSITF